ncbi:hypothetical protein MAR_015004 [Mya arenaria]|uniref:Decapping nuclease n=1 Tax=Mya arenaria TaxID=6604 RepID=A0ABY7FG33_MYAAR|nr:hypothetical protein MAR_015004 [Mya arenaria]
MQTYFICNRGLLKRLLHTPYVKKQTWKFAVTLHKGTYYFCEYHTGQKLAFIKQMTGGSNQEMCAWCFKFKQYLTAIYCGEVDAVPVNPDGSKGDHYVEFKTTKYSALQRESFKRYNLLLSGNQNVLVEASDVVDTECSYEPVSVQSPVLLTQSVFVNSPLYIPLYYLHQQAPEVEYTECSDESVSVAPIVSYAGSSFLSGGHKVFLRVFPRLSVGSVMLELLASYKHTKRKIYQE